VTKDTLLSLIMDCAFIKKYTQDLRSPVRHAEGTSALGVARVELVDRGRDWPIWRSCPGNNFATVLV
jgi:hypothetical protein